MQDERREGQSSYTLSKLLTHALNLITGFSTLPLRIATFIGFGFTIVGLGVLIYVVGRFLFAHGSVPGFPFLASIIAVFSGAQLCALGIIGEYIARIHVREYGSSVVGYPGADRVRDLRTGENTMASIATSPDAISLAALASAVEAPIPFNRFCKTGNEFANIQRAIDLMHISGDGEFTAACSRLLETALGVPKVLLTTSCTHALEMSALLLDIKPGDEVIVPSFTFVSTPNAYVLRGAKPVFVDVRPDTLNMDERLLESKITSRTRAIVPVHYAGVGCEMDTILDIANRHGIPVVEDNAHGLFGAYKDKPLGTFGCMATLSFHETKNFTCGEGGLVDQRQALH